MQVAKAKVWKTADGQLVEDGHEDAAFLFASKGMMIPDHIVTQFDNGGDFFEDVSVTKQEVFSHPTAESFKVGQSNVGKKEKEKEPPNNVPVPGPEFVPGSTNVGKKQGKGRTSSVVQVDDPTPIADDGPSAGQTNVGGKAKEALTPAEGVALIDEEGDAAAAARKKK